MPSNSSYPGPRDSPCVLYVDGDQEFIGTRQQIDTSPRTEILNVSSDSLSSTDSKCLLTGSPLRIDPGAVVGFTAVGFFLPPDDVRTPIPASTTMAMTTPVHLHILITSTMGGRRVTASRLYVSSRATIEIAVESTVFRDLGEAEIPKHAQRAGLRRPFLQHSSTSIMRCKHYAVVCAARTEPLDAHSCRAYDDRAEAHFP